MSANPYRTPDVAIWLDSFEGVPEATGSVPAEPMAGWRGQMNRLLAWSGLVAPGFMLALVIAVAASAAALWVGVDLLGYVQSPVSPILFAVLGGIVIRNVVGLPTVYQRGVHLCLKPMLQIGIVLLGIRLSLVEATQLGLVGLPIILASIATALVLVTWISRMIDLSPRLGSLIGVGTSICGVSAIVAAAPVIKAEEDEVSYAVACVTIFGIVALVVYPFVAHFIFAGDPYHVGLFLGTAIHDTSQTAGAAMSYQQQYAAPDALNAAVVTKLVRNLCMVGVLPLMGLLYHRRTQAGRALPAWHKLVPLFVLGFLLMTFLRTIGDLGERPFALLEPDAWAGMVGRMEALSGWCLMLAMAAVGLSTSLRRMRHLGLRPLGVALVAAVAVGVVAGLLIKLIDPVL